MATPGDKVAKKATQQQVAVRYDELMARYANQVMLRSTPEEVYLEFSSGVIQDPASGVPLMPIHTRIAMSHGAARRLAEILTQACAKPPTVESSAQTTGPASAQPLSGFPPVSK